MRHFVHTSLIMFCSLCFSNAFAQTAKWKIEWCIDTAIANNLTLKQAGYTVAINNLNLKQSKNNLLPNLAANIDEAVNIGKAQNPVTGVFENSTTWATGAGISLSQNLFSGLQYLNIIKQNELICKSSKYDVEDEKFNLTINVLNAFLQVLYTHETIKVACNQLVYDSLQFQTTSDMAYVGKKTESDLLQVKSQLSSDNFLWVSAVTQWKVAKVNLQQLINIPVTETFDIDYSVSVEPVVNNTRSIEQVYIQSLLFQPVIKSYALKTQSAEYALRAAKGAYYPQLLLKGDLATQYSSAAKQTSVSTDNSLQQIGYLQSNPNEVVLGQVPHQTTAVSSYPFFNQMGDNISGTFSLALSIPILNYLQARNNVKRQQINLSSARVNEEIVHVNLRKTIEQVYTNVENSSAQYRSALEEMEASGAAYSQAKAKYEEGKIIVVDLTVQANAYLKAEADYLQTKYSLLFNDKILSYYQGKPITF